MRVDKSIPTFTWVNHASFVLECGDVRLICDPWLDGTIFNHGWRLITPTRFTHKDFAGITHLWYSHQHPDHFYPPDLRKVDPDVRKEIAVMYHRTIDRKVVRFCRGVGFQRQIEMSERRWYRLSPEVEVCCGTWFERDSWLAVRTPHGTILNINDCLIDAPAQARSIAKSVGPVRVLMTQYSYAQWVSNPSQPELRRISAREHLDRMAMQADIFKPEYIIPFASFVYFCHEENFYLNDHMNQTRDVGRFIEERTRRRPVVLYPGQTWRLGDSHDWRVAAEKYEGDFHARVEQGPTVPTKSVPIETLKAGIAAFLTRLRQRNTIVGLIPKITTTVRLNDLGCTVALSWVGLQLVDKDQAWDIEMSSDSLYFCLRTPWGSNTLLANGRFVSGPDDGYVRFMRFFKLADWNDHGYLLAPRRFLVVSAFALKQFGRKLLRKLSALRATAVRSY